jgi:hypothetical protein
MNRTEKILLKDYCKMILSPIASSAGNSVENNGETYAIISRVEGFLSYAADRL